MSDVLIYDVSLDEERPVTARDIERYYDVNARYGKLITALRVARNAGQALPEAVEAIVAEADARRDAAMVEWVAGLPQLFSTYANAGAR